MQTIYRTDDGIDFESEDDAKAHEERLSVQPEINDWLDRMEYSPKKAKELSRVIFAWECRNV